MPIGKSAKLAAARKFTRCVASPQTMKALSHETIDPEELKRLGRPPVGAIATFPTKEEREAMVQRWKKLKK